MNVTADQVFLEFAIMIMAGLVASRLADLLRIPDIVLYLVVGIVLGPPVLGWFNIPADSTASEFILAFGASFMLYEGGREVNLDILKSVWRTVTLLATTGVLITALPVALAASWLLHLPFLPALLLASVLSPTDPATIIPIFQQIRLVPRLAQTAQSESAFNDATGSVLVVSVTAILMAGHVSALHLTWQFIWLIVGGLAVGFIVAYVGTALAANGSAIPQIFDEQQHQPLMSLIIIILAYLGAEVVGASGFMAVFVAGITVGNKPAFGFSTPEEHEYLHDRFFGVTAIVMRMFIFILLGSHVNFAVLERYALPLVGIILVFMFIARPLTVLLSAGLDRAVGWTRNELLFLMWVRETGVIPAALSGILVAEGAPNAELISGAVFAAILATLLIQASTTPLVARRLGVLAGSAAKQAG